MIVWLASYPRSGNTFFRVVLNSIFDVKTYSIHGDKGDIGADEKTSEVVGHEFLPDDFDLQKARDEEKNYYLKTHALLDNSVDENDKVIYLIRDGRESTLSFTNHQNTFSNQNKKLIDVIYGDTFFGSWGDHITSWNPKNRENTLLMKFEELTKEPVKFIEMLSNFLDIKPVGDKIPSFDELKKINPKFFRNGKTNSWENIYTEEEHLAFWIKNNQVMVDYGYSYKELNLHDAHFQSRVALGVANQNSYILNLVFDEKKNLQRLNYNFELLTKIVEQNHKMLSNTTRKLHEEQREQIQQISVNNEKVLNELKSLKESDIYKLGTFISYPYIMLVEKYKSIRKIFAK